MMDRLNLSAIREEMVLDSQKKYAEGGYTTVQDGRTDNVCLELLIKLAK